MVTDNKPVLFTAIVWSPITGEHARTKNLSGLGVLLGVIVGVFVGVGVCDAVLVGVMVFVGVTDGVIVGVGVGDTGTADDACGTFITI